VKGPSLLIIGAVLLAGGCREPEPPPVTVARVDDQVLTLEEVQSRFDSTRGPSEAQLYAYIQRWILNELLYREAVRRGMDRSADMESKLQTIRRRLAINALLDEEIYSEQTLEVSDSVIARYYEEHKEEFPLSDDVALMSFVLFVDRTSANAFRTRVLRGTDWYRAVEEIAADSQRVGSILARVDSTYYTQATLASAQLWRVATSTSRQQPTIAVRTDEGFYVLVVWKYDRKGSLADLGYVKNEVQSRIVIQNRQEMLSQLIQNLRERHDVQIFAGTTVPDTLILGKSE